MLRFKLSFQRFGWNSRSAVMRFWVCLGETPRLHVSRYGSWKFVVDIFGFRFGIWHSLFGELTCVVLSSQYLAEFSALGSVSRVARLLFRLVRRTPGGDCLMLLLSIHPPKQPPGGSRSRNPDPQNWTKRTSAFSPILVGKILAFLGDVLTISMVFCKIC